ncbi:tubulointerstitial nephritis antigen-like [Ostrinia nubilalis]|uniref:tubulointerstitial nephritis antigen-like n=1 Tax=Ostrinia nubilalis TaxID=29057 RepID=UPI00308268DC
MANNIYFLMLCVALGAVVAYRGNDLPPGPYCGTPGRQQCCDNRQDACSHRILDTLCYCDQFCNRTSSPDDCCPDYEEVCLGIKPTPPPQPLQESCKMNGKTYFPLEGADTTMKDCNTCKCILREPNKAEWDCETDECVLNEEVIRILNRPGYSWRSANYSQFRQYKLKDALVYKLGTLPLSRETLRLNPIRPIDNGTLIPRNFDAREKWRGFISPVVDQGWCGSDWAVVVATVTSDRYAIQSTGAEVLVLSPQSLLSCSRKNQRGCDGGHIDIAWNFAKNFGLVDEDCYPYEATASACKLRKHRTLQEEGCRPAVPRRTQRYKVGPPGRLQKEKDIMLDIMQSGPVHAIMSVYQDFFHYQDGIYRRSMHGNNQLKGLHSVRIVGWGENRGEKYWIVANSWGPWWGENGYFKIARGVNTADIETFVISVLSEVTESYKK